MRLKRLVCFLWVYWFALFEIMEIENMISHIYMSHVSPARYLEC